MSWFKFPAIPRPNDEFADATEQPPSREEERANRDYRDSAEYQALSPDEQATFDAVQAGEYADYE